MAPDRQSKTRSGRLGFWVRLLLGLTLVLGAAGTVGLSQLDPEGSQRFWGAARIAAARVTAGADLPTVRLIPAGGTQQLRKCDPDSFAEMTGYQRRDLPPTYAAHNLCGGDVILAWEVGQQVKIVGSATVYEVVDLRVIPKFHVDTEDLVGIEGELLLQSCFYGEPRMKIVGLAAIST